MLFVCRVLEPPSEWILNPADIETRQYDAGEYVFQPGDHDLYLYVVLEGSMEVCITDYSGELSSYKPMKEYPMKQIRQGDAVYSLLSILDIIAVSLFASFLNSSRGVRKEPSRKGISCKTIWATKYPVVFEISLQAFYDFGEKQLPARDCFTSEKRKSGFWSIERERFLIFAQF